MFGVFGILKSTETLRIELIALSSGSAKSEQRSAGFIGGPGYVPAPSMTDLTV